MTRRQSYELLLHGRALVVPIALGRPLQTCVLLNLQARACVAQVRLAQRRDVGRGLVQHRQRVAVDVEAEEQREQLGRVPLARAEGEEERARVVCDYIAGMTDQYALMEYRKLTDNDVFMC